MDSLCVYVCVCVCVVCGSQWEYLLEKKSPEIFDDLEFQHWWNLDRSDHNKAQHFSAQI